MRRKIRVPYWLAILHAAHQGQCHGLPVCRGLRYGSVSKPFATPVTPICVMSSLTARPERSAYCMNAWRCGRPPKPEDRDLGEYAYSPLSGNPLCCLASLLGFACCLRLRFRRSFLLCIPESLHSLRLLLALSGSELATRFLGRLSSSRRAGNGSSQRILRRPTPALRRSLKHLDRSVQLVSFCNQKSKDLFCRHRENLSTHSLADSSDL